MATPMQPQKIRDLGIYGVIRRAEIDDTIIPDGAVVESVNYHFDRRGASSVRPGMTALGSTISNTNPCLGLFNAQSSILIASFIQSGSMTISEYSGAAWNTLHTGTGGSTATRFADFAGRTIIVSGLERSIRAWNGSGLDSVNATIENTGNPINPQQLWYVNANTSTGYIRPKFIEVYKSRLYLSGDSVNPDRLYFSSIITSAGNITWAPSTDFVDINPNDGENITALKRYSLELLIFKPNYIYRFRSTPYLTTAIDPDPLINKGTRSQESVVEGKKGVYFHHDTGFYRYSGGYPEEISRPISDIIEAIPYSQFGSVAAWKDNDHIYWFLGNLTIVEQDVKTGLNNVVVRYTESSEVWTIYAYGSGLRRGSDFNNNSTLVRVVGNDNGVVSTFNSGNTDIGEPINSRIITKWYEWEGIANQKVIQQMVAVADRAMEAHVMYQAEGNYNWKDLGQIRYPITFFDPLDLKFHRLRFKIAGVNTTTASVFLGLEIIQGLNEGIVKI